MNGVFCEQIITNNSKINNIKLYVKTIQRNAFR